VKVRIGRVPKNLIADHLSRIVVYDTYETPIFQCFPNDQLFRAQVELWHADIVNYLMMVEMPMEGTTDDRAPFLSMVMIFTWDDPYLFKYC